MFAIRLLYLIGAFVYGFILAATASAGRQRRARVPDSWGASQPQS